MASEAPKILDTKSNISCTGRTYKSAGTTRLGPSFRDYRKDSRLDHNMSCLRNQAWLSGHEDLIKTRDGSNDQQSDMQIADRNFTLNGTSIIGRKNCEERFVPRQASSDLLKVNFDQIKEPTLTSLPTKQRRLPQATTDRASDRLANY
ncbi:MAG: hypothetical protein Q9192_004549 [Flavoplaca navasiana]